MKQETKPLTKEVIDEFRQFFEEGLRLGAISGEEQWKSILAVLEAAQRWAETSTAIRNTSPVTQEMWASHNQNCDALLALIDLGGTE